MTRTLVGDFGRAAIDASLRNNNWYLLHDNDREFVSQVVQEYSGIKDFNESFTSRSRDEFLNRDSFVNLSSDEAIIKKWRRGA